MTQRPTSGRTFLACALLSFAFTVSVAAQPTEWKEHVSDRGKFSVSLPGAPETGYRVSDPNSGLEEVYEKGAKTWKVYYFDLPEIPSNANAVKKVLKRRRDIIVIKPGSEKSLTKSLTMSGYPALEIKSPIYDRDKVWIVRIVLVKQRVYELWVFTQAKQAASEDYATQAEVAFDRFLLAHLSRFKTGDLLAELVKDLGRPAIIPRLDHSHALPMQRIGQQKARRGAQVFFLVDDH